jgi:glycosyltransferase involved in cell wall biosynthesis
MTKGPGSFRAVVDGHVEGLTDLGWDVRVTPLNEDDDLIALCADCNETVGVLFGLPKYAKQVFGKTAHLHRILFIATNTNAVPDFVFDAVRETGARLYTPSRFCAETLVRDGIEPALMAHHGVDKHYLAEPKAPYVPWDGKRALRFLHCTSSMTGRKGTRELLQAWGDVLPKMPEGSQLTVQCSDIRLALSFRETYEFVDGVRFQHGTREPSEMPDFYRSFDAVVQPSRAEGFGMVPLQAIAAGSWALMSSIAAHYEWSGEWIGPPVVTVYTGDEMPIEDGPGAMAPAIEAHAIWQAFHEFMNRWSSRYFADKAMWGPKVAKEMQWANVLRPVWGLEDSVSGMMARGERR